MNKPLYFPIQELEFDIIEQHCKAVGRTKSYVLRKLIKSLKVKVKPSSF